MINLSASEALQWAALATAALSGGALALKRLLTTWNKETAQANGMAAANDIIEALRSEVEHVRKHSSLLSTQHEEAIMKIVDLQQKLGKLHQEKMELEMENQELKFQIGSQPQTPPDSKG